VSALRTDRSAPSGQRTMMEPGLDLELLRRQRTERIQRELRARDVGAVLLTDTINIRYATGLSVMPLWTAVNLAHYVLVPAEGAPIVFEYPQALFRAQPFFGDVRPTKYWQSRFVDNDGANRSRVWADEIAAALRERGLGKERLGIDALDFFGFKALEEAGLTLADADEPMEAARMIKLPAEIELMKQSAAVAEAALFAMEQAIVPGVTENELLGTFWHRMLSLGGEWCYTRLVASGHKTNPWFHEAGQKMVRPGDLVGIDTDMIGPEGYACDISRTFLCGDRASADQREAYRIAHDFLFAAMDLCRPGVSYEELARRLPEVPEAYRPLRYPVAVHGIGTDDEPPFVPFHDQPGAVVPRGELVENMVLCVEFYAGVPGRQDGVKLEDQVLVTKDGPVLLTHYPYEAKLLHG